MKVMLENEDILFIPLAEKYIPDYLKMVNDYENVGIYISKQKRTFNYEEELNWIEEKRKNKAIIFTMLEKETQKFIGNIEILEIKDNKARIGISITKEMQNKHYGSKALKTFINYCFHTLNLNEIDLEVYSHNKRGINCYQKVGFIPYKTIKNVTNINEESIDEIYMKITK